MVYIVKDEMEVSVSNLQILGAIDGLRAQIEALTAALQGGGQSGGSSELDAPAAGAEKVKRRRAKSRYNDHMSEELARLKVEQPDIGHRRRFAMAVASWKDIKKSENELEGGSATDPAIGETNTDAVEPAAVAEADPQGDQAMDVAAA